MSITESITQQEPAREVYPSPRTSGNWLIQTAWPLPALAMLGMGLWRLTEPQIWRDEAATWSAADRPIPDMVQLAQHIDAVLSPYYLFMHFWIRLFGAGEFALRLPSVLAMTAAAALTAVIGKKLIDPVGGVVAGLLFALVPSVSQHAQEARPYAIATFAAALATLLLLNALKTPSWPRWAGYAAAVTLLGLAHIVALVMLAGHAVGVGWRLRQTGDRRSLRWLLACAAGLIPLAPIVGLGMRQRQVQIGGLIAPSWQALLTLPAEVFQSGMVAGIVVGLGLLAPWLIGRSPEDPMRRGGTFMLTGMAAGSFALLWLISQVKSFWFTRYLLFTTPAWTLLAAMALVSIRIGSRQVTLAMVAVAVVAGLSANDHQELRQTTSHDRFNYPYPLPDWAPPLSDYRSAARIMTTKQQDGDAMLYANRRAWQALVMDYELRGGAGPRDVLRGSSRTAVDNFWGVDCAQPAACFGEPARVWVIAVGNPADPLAVMPPARSALLRDRYQKLRDWRLSGMTLTLFEL